MLLVGITGGIGMGKSACGDILGRLGVPVIDTDSVAREVVEPGQPALAAIREAFGPAVFDSEGRLRRDVVAGIVFQDPAARARLEAILHPRIRETWTQRVEAWRHEGRRCGAVIIPLLFETCAEPSFDAVICVACSMASQHARLLKRGWSESQIAARIDAQLPVGKKILRSHFLVWTEPPLAVHEAQVRRVLRTLSRHAVAGSCGW